MSPNSDGLKLPGWQKDLGDAVKLLMELDGLKVRGTLKTRLSQTENDMWYDTDKTHTRSIYDEMGIGVGNRFCKRLVTEKRRVRRRPLAPTANYLRADRLDIYFGVRVSATRRPGPSRAEWRRSGGSKGTSRGSRGWQSGGVRWRGGP